MRRQQHLLVCVFGLLFSSLFGFATVFGTPPAKAVSSAMTIGGPFTLTAVDGKTVTDRTCCGIRFSQNSLIEFELLDQTLNLFHSDIPTNAQRKLASFDKSLISRQFPLTCH